MRPEDIKNRTFAHALRGYDKDEVRSFLFKVGESSRELHERLTATEAQLVSAVAPEVADDEHDVGAESQTMSDNVPAALAGAVDADVALSFDFAATDTSVLDVDATSDVEAHPGDEPVSVDAAPDPSAFVEAPVASLASAEQAIADRYGALGDRIADLLRNADESAAEILTSADHHSAVTRAAADTEAAQVRTDAEERASQMLAEAQSIRAEADAYRDEVMAELASARLEQDAALQEARAAAEGEVETFRVDSIEEITSLRSDAFVEIDELRTDANVEVAELRSAAQIDAGTMRETAIAEAAAAVADDEAEASHLLELAETDRVAARAELEDVRSEVSTLLEQARTQSEFIKQEADEIIRTKVRSNFEQAQTRIEVLRNTEVASRERIVLAQSELTSALDRLDADPMPELDPSDSPAVIEEAERRHDELSTGTSELESSVDDADADADAIETELDEPEFVEAGVIEAELVETGFVDIDTPLAADIATDPQELEGDSLSSYFGPGPAEDDAAMGDVLAGAFGGDAEPLEDESTSIDTGWPTTEVSDVETVEYEAGTPDEPLLGAFEAQAADAQDGNFGITEHVVVESAEYGELPVRGDASRGNPLPVRGEDRSDVEHFTNTDSFGAASLAEALPVEMDAPELGGATQEDALARLVREAMQEAVDSARKND